MPLESAGQGRGEALPAINPVRRTTMNAKKIDQATDEAGAMVGAAARLLSVSSAAAQNTGMSDETARCVQALECMKAMTELADERCAELGPNANESFDNWANEATLEYQQRLQWAEAVQQAVFALERCVRTAPCKTTADIAAKMKFTSYFASFKDPSTHEDYSEESLQLVRSIAAMFQDDSSQAAEGSVRRGKR